MVPGYRFGPFELDVRGRELRKHGQRLRVQEQPFRILVFLLEHAGDLVTRDDLCRLLWPDGTVVDFDKGLNAAMGKLRQALRDAADKPRYIETVPRRGYRFVAPIEPLAEFASGGEPRETPGRAVAPPGTSWWAAAYLRTVVVLACCCAGLLVHLLLKGQPARPALAVLPFEDLDQGSSRQYLADGLTEELTTELSRLEPQRLAVVGRTTALLYRKAGKSIAQIGRELGVDYLLEGSIRSSTDTVRLTVQLIRVRDQMHIWADNYDSRLGDVLVFEADAARAVAHGIGVALSSRADARLSAVRAVDPRAHEAYLRGRYFLWSAGITPQSAETAVSYLQAAVRLDGRYSAAYAALAEYYSILPEVSHSHLQENLRLARTYAAKALELDGSLAEAHMSMAFIALLERDWNNAQRYFDRTLELDPTLVRARALYAVYLLAVGEPRQAVAQIRKAQALDPLFQSLRSHVQRTLYFARQHLENLEECRKILELRPAAPDVYISMAMSYAELGRFEQAADMLAKARARSPGGPVNLMAEGYIAARSGRRDEARSIAKVLEKQSDEDFTAAYKLAVIYAALGERQRAIDWLETSYAQGDPTLSNRLKPDPKLDSLRSEPRFRTLAQRLNYP